MQIVIAFVIALFFSMFIAVIVTIASFFPYVLLLSVLYNNALSKVLKKVDDAFLTDTVIERYLRRDHPRVWWMKQNTSIFMLGVLGTTYVLSVILITALGSSISINF